MADKGALELIGAMLFAATLFVVGAGGIAVRHQLAAEPQKAETVALAQLPDRLHMDGRLMPVELRVVK